jgi:ribose 1,5-bisphosphokinase PhnN
VTDVAARVVWVYGPPGVGKSTVGWALSDRSVESGLRTAYVDIDQLGMCYPASAADPFRDRLKATSLARVLANFRAAGAQRCIVSGVLHPTAFPIYASAVRDHDVRFIRLTADHDVLRERLLRRGGRNGADIADAIEEAVALNRSRFGHPTIDTDGVPVDDVVERAAVLLDNHPPVPTRPRELSGPATAPGRIVVVSGATAVGKSSVAWILAHRLREEGGVCAFADLQQLGFLRPADPEPAMVRLRAANLGAFWDACHEAGADDLVVAGSIASMDEARTYRRALPNADVTVVRLTAEPTTLRRRLHERRLGGPAVLAGDHLLGQPAHVLDRLADEACAAAERLAAAPFEDLVVDTSDRTVDEAAEAIAGHVRPSAESERVGRVGP